MLVLPNGHLLFSVNGDVFDFAPNGSANAAWKPTISSIVQTGSTYTLTGKQLTGISEGASYGDDAEMSTNYPIVRLTDSTGKVKYARTTNWTPSVAAGNTVQTVQFTLPAGTTSGTYRVAVIANGIASAETNLKITIVTTLTLSNPSTITYHKQQAATAIDSGITLTSNLSSLSYATVTIKNYAGTQDVLGIMPTSAMGNITWKYQSGVLTLTSTGATATPAQFQAALRAATYFNGSSNPNTTPRQVEFKVFGTSAMSNAVLCTINVSNTRLSPNVVSPAIITPTADPAMFSDKKSKSRIFPGV
jgi:hypothetical protein